MQSAVLLRALRCSRGPTGEAWTGGKMKQKQKAQRAAKAGVLHDSLRIPWLLCFAGRLVDEDIPVILPMRFRAVYEAEALLRVEGLDLPLPHECPIQLKSKRVPKSLSDEVRL